MGTTSAKIAREGICLAPIVYLMVRVHEHIVPVDRQYRVLVPALVMIMLLTKREVPFFEKFRKHAWASLAGAFTFFLLFHGYSLLSVILLALTLAGFFVPSIYLISTIANRMTGGKLW